MDPDTFDDETPRLRDCWESEPSARNRAVSLSTGIGAPSWGTRSPGSGPSGTNCCCSANILKSCATLLGLSLARLCRCRTKTAATTSIATATISTIAPMISFLFLNDAFFPGGPSGYIVRGGTLRKNPSQERKKGRPACANFRANGANTAPCAGLINTRQLQLGPQI